MLMENPKRQRLDKAKIEGVRRLAHQNLRMILKLFGFRGQDLGSRIVGCCPHPHAEGHTPNDNYSAFSWDFSREMWQCFTHRCHDLNGSDVFALVQTVRNCNFPEAVEWILETVGAALEDVKDIDAEERQRLEQVIRKRSRFVTHSRMEDDLMRHLKPSTYFKSRGFSDEVIKEFGVGGEWYRLGTYGEKRVIVPVYDPLEGYLIAFTCRLLDDSLIEAWRPKWCHALNFAEQRKKSEDRTDEERFYASSVLYNLYRAKEHMGSHKTIILVEGPGDVMRMWEAGIKNVVAVLGTGFGKNHRTLLHKVGCAKVVCALDPDAAGARAVDTVKKTSVGYFEFAMAELLDGKDPGDHDPSQLRMIFKEYT